MPLGKINSAGLTIPADLLPSKFSPLNSASNILPLNFFRTSAMTGSVNPSTSSGRPLGDGVLAESEGVILQRGGEELALVKVSDRFTIRPVPNRSLRPLAQRIGVLSAQPIPSVQLIELRVAPGQLDAAMTQVRSAEEVAFASHVYQLQNSPQTLVYLTDQITLQFVESVSLETVRAIAAQANLQAMQPVQGIPQTFVFRVTLQADANPIKLANRLMRYPEVLTAEPNVVIQTQTFYRPRDPLYPKQWYLHHDGGTQLAAGSHISAEAAWDVTRGNRSIVVAVTDDGFDLNHPDFQGKGKIVAPRDLRNQNPVPTPEASHENHGTAVAGLAIAEENGVGIVGVAPGCGFMPIRTTGFLDDQALEQMFSWAMDNGAAVIVCSWGPSAVYFPISLRQRAVLTRAATEGRNGKGCVIVFAAGNSNRPINGSVNEQGWPNNILRGPTDWMNGFAIHPDVIAVSACTSLNQKAAYSNWGANIAVVAPSNNGSPGTWLQATGYIKTPPIVQMGLLGKGVLTSDRMGSEGYDAGAFTESFGGTSSACPLVAGVAALVLSVNPELTARDVRQILQETTDKITDSTADPQLGLQKGTYDANGHSQWFGYGKVNALKAVRAAQQRLVTPSRASRQIQQQNTTTFDIPDASPQGVRSTIQIGETGSIKDIQVTVQIEHNFLGDIEVSLIAPNNQTVLLQSRILGNNQLLQTTYTSQNTPVLRQLFNQSSAGRWQLWVVDYAPVDTGQLKRWQLQLGV